MKEIQYVQEVVTHFIQQVTTEDGSLLPGHTVFSKHNTPRNGAIRSAQVKLQILSIISPT